MPITRDRLKSTGRLTMEREKKKKKKRFALRGTRNWKPLLFVLYLVSREGGKKKRRRNLTKLSERFGKYRWEVGDNTATFTFVESRRLIDGHCRRCSMKETREQHSHSKIEKTAWKTARWNETFLPRWTFIKYLIRLFIGPGKTYRSVF